MADALLRDLRDDGRCAIRTVRDPAVALPFASLETLWARSPDAALAALDTACRGAALAFVIAPETGGVLEALTRRVAAAGVAIAGASADAIAVAASKRRTAAALAARGLRVAPHYAAGPLPGKTQSSQRWVVKPDDGAGCERTLVAGSWHEAVALASAGRCGDAVLQPLLAGESLSLSCLAGRRGTRVLSVNRQHVVCAGDALRFDGVTVGTGHSADWQPAAIASGVAAALPGLYGYFGVDLVLEEGGPVILEVNPRLTTSAAGLREACGVNLATLVLDDLLATAAQGGPACATA